MQAIKKMGKYPIEIHNVMSHNLSFEFVTKCDGGGWVFKNTRIIAM